MEEYFNSTEQCIMNLLLEFEHEGALDGGQKDEHHYKVLATRMWNALADGGHFES